MTFVRDRSALRSIFNFSKFWKQDRSRFHISKVNQCNMDLKVTEGSVKEIQIPLRSGYLAAKIWGPGTGDPFVALHGWQDNAGTFDTLIPLLSPNLNIVAIDLIGHGLSSHKPIGSQYYNMEFIYHLKCIADYLNWNKFSVLGHSMGSAMGIMFAGIYPQMVKRIIGIDLLKPVSYPNEIVSDMMRRNIERYIKQEKKLKNTPPTYTSDEALQIILERNTGIITESSAKILMKRGTKEAGNGKLIFSRDIRIKSIWDSGLVCDDVLKGVLSNISCDLLLIKATESPTYSEEGNLNETLEIYKKKCKTFELVEVEGNHYVHLNNPERVAPIINSFLVKTQSSL